MRRALPFRAPPDLLRLLLAFVGTALATSLIGLVIVAAFGAGFSYSARVEEETLTSALRAAYPPCQAGTRMLVPLVL